MKTSRPSVAFAHLRLATVLALCLAAFALGVVALAQPGKAQQVQSSRVPWPSLDQQLAQQYVGRAVQPGSALEQLIRENQDFSILRDEEKQDKITLPAWLRVWWRKAHPEANYAADDPTGGYPRVLNEILEWMLTHQDLKAGPGVEQAGANDPDASVGPDLRMSGAQSTSRSESDVRINYWDTQKILSASNSIASGGTQAIFYSTNGGTSWNQTTLPLASGDTSHSDPTVDWTSDGTAWSSTLGIVSNTLRMRNYFSSNNGASWTLEATPSGTQTNVDKQMVWVDHSASSPFKNRMYAIWHNGNPAYVNRRTPNPGGSWLAAPIPLSGAESSGTCIGSDIKSNSAGDVFAAWPATTGSKIFVARSTNGGDSWGAPVQAATTFDSYDIGVPSFSSRRALIYVSLGTYRSGATNNVYLAWTDLSGVSGCTAPGNEPNTNAASTCKTRIWFARSTDGGTTWAPPIKVNDQPGLNDQFNQWLAVDETNGTIGIIYYDTVSDAARKKTEVWYQSSINGGLGWSAPQKVSSGTTDETISGADSGNQYGDYNGLSAYGTLFMPSWTDRRNLAREEVWTNRIVDTQTPTPSLSGSGSTITAGNCGSPTTASLEPGETVTISFCVQNSGSLATSNLVGTLQASGGVTNPSAPQAFGVVVANGGNACRSYTFQVGGTCGGSVTASLQLQDGASSLGTANYNYTTGTPVISYTEAFDSVVAPALPASWVAANASGAAPLWVTSNATPDSGVNAAFVDDPAAVSDKRLDSPSVTINSANATLTFRNNYNLETNFDGGVLEVSAPGINGGVFTDVTNAAVGGSFISGGYTGTISTSYSNPIGGRQAWTGNSNGYITTVANLGPNLVGQTVKFRFRMGSDTSASGAGWRIDGLSLQNGTSCPCAPVPVSVVSRKSHNGQNYDVNLPLNGAIAVEPRSGGAGGNHQIVVTFSSAIMAGSANVASGSGSVSTFSVNGSQLTINLQNVADAQTTVVNISGASDGTNVGDLSVPVSFLLGDVSGDGSVNSGDATIVRNRSGLDADATSFRADFNLDGTINSADATIVRARSGQFVP